MTSKGRKKGPPAHQNTFAFRHNPKSKKTEKIVASPNQGLCQRCHDKVEWRKKYRKYKPLTAPATCNICRQKTVRAAYHTVCQPCAQAKNACAWCLGSKAIVSSKDRDDSFDAQRTALERDIKGLHLRKQRTILREFDKTQGKMDVEEAIKKAAAGEDEEDWDDDNNDEDFADEDFDDEDSYARLNAGRGGGEGGSSNEEDDWWDGGEGKERKGEVGGAKGVAVVVDEDAKKRDGSDVEKGEEESEEEEEEVESPA